MVTAVSGSRRRDYAGAGLTPRNSPLVLTLIVIFLASSIVTGAASAQQLVVRVLAAAVMVIALGSLSGLPRPAPAGVCSISLVVATVAPAALVFASWTRIPGAGDYLWSWPLFLAGIIEVTLCFKGRLRTAIVIHLGVAAALAVRASQVDGTPATAAPALVSYLPMFLVSLLIAFYVRPVADEIAALRDSGDAAGRLADIAVAVVVARNERLDWIDRTAGPWLRRIASGIPLDDAERRACLFLEASIRDVLRAPGLVGPELDRVVAAARERGVEVVLLDDGSLDGAPARLRVAARKLVAARIAGTDDGRVTARISPPGRDEVATILRTTSGAAERIVLRRSDLENTTPRDTP